MMEQISENNSALAGKSAAIPAASLGSALREARERLGLSVADVANQIKFAPRQIEALEADDFQHLPEAAFLRGFIRSYAKILQLDAQTLLAMLPKTKAASMELVPASVEVPFPDAPRSLLRQNMIWLGAAALLAVIAAGFALWNFVSPLKQTKVVQVETPLSLPAEVQIIPDPLAADDRVTAPPDTSKRSTVTRAQSSVPAAKTQAGGAEPQLSERKPALQSAAPPPAQPVKSVTKPVTAPPVEQAAIQSDASAKVTQLRLEFDAESWTEIRDRDGKILSSKINPAGSELTVNGRAPFTMLIGHGLSVRLYHDGKPVDLAPFINKYSEVAHVTLK